MQEPLDIIDHVALEMEHIENAARIVQKNFFQDDESPEIANLFTVIQNAERNLSEAAAMISAAMGGVKLGYDINSGRLAHITVGGGINTAQTQFVFDGYNTVTINHYECRRAASHTHD